jgi:hypothetical protein
MQTPSDNIYQEFKLYIEGVQVPFINIAINQSFGGLPSASISIPPMAGMMDIARFYQPKVHVFFTERFSPDTNKEKVLFTGNISAAHYSKSKDGNGNMGIVFDCTHRYNLITESLLDYCGFIRDGDLLGSPHQSTTAEANSRSAIIEALNGWTAVGTPRAVGATTGTAGPLEDYSAANPSGPVSKITANGTTSTHSRVDVLPSNLAPFQNRLKGMVGVFINFWNQRKRDSYNPNWKAFQGSFTNIYEPLIEDGLQFFKRLTGHMVIEEAIDSEREQTCKPDLSKNIMIPPCHKMFFKSSVQASLTLDSLQSFLQNSNEITNMYEIFQKYYQTIEYDIVTLACPAEVPMDPKATSTIGNSTFAVDTIIKPTMPFYYSPMCNVLLPTMYSSINVSYDESSMPTRIDVLHHEQNTNNIPLHYRAPETIRESIAYKNGNGDLSSTLHSSMGAIGRYEMGRGIKYESYSTPSWLNILAAAQSSNNSTFLPPDPNSIDAKALSQLATGWNLRNPKANASLNPFTANGSGLQPHEALIVATADYYYSKRFASTKVGNVNCLFNPYIVPGYPMDILEKSPNLPSFHAMCVAVSHNITANSLSTQVSFSAAMTYTELANYYIPFVNPYLQVQLGLAANPTLVNTDSTGSAKLTADNFYKPVLGVQGATPEMIYDFSTGVAKSVKMSGGILSNNTSPSFEEDLISCRRPIESKVDYANRMGLIFIDMVPSNYTAIGTKYEDPNLSSAKVDSKLEVGQSQFLDYSETIYNLINTY